MVWERANRCACRKSNPDILVVQPAENWAAKNVLGPLDGARDRVHPDDRAANAPGLGIPAYAITDLEGFGHDGSVQPKQTSAPLWRSPRSHCCRSQRCLCLHLVA
jgi:hypothetical protein